VAGFLAKGWQVNTMAVLQSGTPFNITNKVSAIEYRQRRSSEPDKLRESGPLIIQGLRPARRNANSLDILRPVILDSNSKSPHNHVGRGRFTVFNEACEDATNRSLGFPTEPFLGSGVR
jgi:hypothetical protein